MGREAIGVRQFAVVLLILITVTSSVSLVAAGPTGTPLDSVLGRVVSTAIGETVPFCGRVANAVGWSLAGMTVEAIPTGTSVAGTAPITTTTDASGEYRLDLENDSYVLAIFDANDPTTAGRDGAVYSPFTDPSTNPGTLPFAANACADGAAGTRRDLIHLTSPAHGFVEVNVTDGAMDTWTPMEDTDVYLAPAIYDNPLQPTLDNPVENGPDAAHAHTNATGIARLACPSAAGSATLVIEDRPYVTTTRSVPCASGVPDATTLHVDLWRIPIRVVVRTTNSTSRDANTGLQSTLDSFVYATPPAGMLGVPCHGAGQSAARFDVPSLTGSTDAPYVCYANATEGVSTLDLPWGGTWTVVAHVPDYANDTEPLALAPEDAETQLTQPVNPHVDPTSLDDAAVSAEATKVLHMALDRPTVTLTGTVTNYVGAPQSGAQLRFAGFQSASTSSGGDGTFSLPLREGNTTLTITASGFNTRVCDLTISHDANGAGTLSNTSCLSLVHTGLAVLRGTLKDATLNKAIPGFTVNDGSTVNFATTNATGVFILEGAPGATLTAAPNMAWTLPTTALHLGAVDSNATLASASLPRVKMTVTGIAQGGSPLAGLQGADATLSVVGATSALSTGTTDALGQFAVANLPWTHLLGDTAGDFDTPSYVFSAQRHGSSLAHYDLGSAPQALRSDSVGNLITLTLAEEAKVVVPVTLVDQQSPANAPIETPTITATAASPIICSPTCSDTSGQLLTLYAEHAYTICTAATTKYAAICLLPATPSTSGLTLQVPRKTVSLTATVMDPHTGLPLQGAVVRASPKTTSFVCAGPPSTNCISPATGPAGTATLNVPWATQDEMCIGTVAGSYTVVVNPTATTANEANVPFQLSRVCADVPATPSTATTTLRPLRAAGLAITGAVTNASSGAPVVGARVTPLTERAISTFTCDPVAHNTPNGAFPACHGVDSSSAGAYSLALPAGTSQDATWRVTVQAHDYYDNVTTTVPAGTRIDAPLQTINFTVTVFLTDSPTCTRQPGTSMDVIVTDEDTGNRTFAPAMTLANGSCVAFVPVTGWAYLAQPLPAGSIAWPKTFDVYDVQVSTPNHVGRTLAMLGPTANVTTIAMHRVSTDPATVEPVELKGRVTDAGGRTSFGDVAPGAPSADATGVAGAMVTAKRVGGGCQDAAATFSAVTDAQGNYDLLLGCSGQYSVSVTHLAALYAASDPKPLTTSGTVAASANLRLDFTLTRVSYAVQIAANGLLGQAEQGIHVHLQGVDTKTTLDATTDPTGVAAFPTLPWGTYVATITDPDGSPVLTPELVVFVAPQTTRTLQYQALIAHIG